MPALTTVNEFLDVLQRSQLLKPALFDKINGQVPTLCEGELTAERFARSLVKSQIISLNQAQKLMAGTTEGFYLGKYKLLDLLGRGGMGKVYLAEQITMNRVVALKVIGRFAKNRSDTIARFAREARAVAALSHPNIIQAFDFDELDGVPFICMEYVEGIDTGEQVDKFGPLGWAQASDYGMQAALGLEAARKAGFVHRDVKPGNLLVDRDGNVKLLDLGLAVGKEEHGNGSLTTAFDQIGTVDYMAPEQAVDSHNVDIRADIYAMGGVLYALVTGRLPFSGKTTAEKLLKHQQTPPQPIRELVPDMPEELARVIHQMLEKKREARPQTPAEVAEALKPFAQRKTPPYDLSAIKHPRESLAPLLGRSPELSEINIRGQLSGINSPVRGGSNSASKVSEGSQSNGSSSNAATQVTAKGTASTMTGLARPQTGSGTQPAVPALATVPAAASASTTPKRQPSAIDSRSPSRVKQKSLQSTTLIIPDQEPQLNDNDFLANLPSAPSIRRLKKKKPKRQKLDNKLITGAGAAVCLIALIIWMMSSGSETPTLTASITINPTIDAPATTPGDTQSGTLKADSSLPSYENWLAFSNEFKNDPDLVFYFTFSGAGDGGDIVRSQAAKPKYGSMNAKVFGARWQDGRFPKKKALQFGGNKSNQYVLLGDNDSNLCNFTTPFSVGVWFRADNLKSAYQALITKGDDSWRLQRNQMTEKLELAANNTFWDAAAKKSDPTKGKQTTVYSLSSVDDKKWHFAVGVYDLQSPKKSLHLYLDGQPEGIAELDRMQSSKHAVCIGANADRLKGSDPRIWSGAIDEVFVLNRALSVSDVARMYAAGRPAE